MSDTVIYCTACDTDIQVVNTQYGWMYMCKCEDDDGTKAAPCPTGTPVTDIHESWTSDSDTYECKWCGREWNHEVVRHRHQYICSENPDHAEGDA